MERHDDPKHIGYKSWNDDFEKDTCPELFRVTSKDGVIISENNGVVEIEAPYYSSKTDAAEAKWTEIPFMGKSVSAMTLMPYTKSIKGASITYKFKMQVSKTSDGKAFNGKQKVRIHVITKSTLDYLNKGGLTYGVSLDGASPVEVNFNKDLNEKPENIYNIYYPTIATRIVDKMIELELPASSDGIHTLTLTPNDPAIVFEKIVIDGRGGKKECQGDLKVAYNKRYRHAPTKGCVPILFTQTITIFLCSILRSIHFYKKNTIVTNK